MRRKIGYVALLVRDYDGATGSRAGVGSRRIADL
jgi:hypothetical protein